MPERQFFGSLPKRDQSAHGGTAVFTIDYGTYRSSRISPKVTPPNHSEVVGEPRRKPAALRIPQSAPGVATVLPLHYGVSEPGPLNGPQSQMLGIERESGAACEAIECPSSRN